MTAVVEEEIYGCKEVVVMNKHRQVVLAIWTREEVVEMDLDVVGMVKAVVPRHK